MKRGPIVRLDGSLEERIRLVGQLLGDRQGERGDLLLDGGGELVGGVLLELEVEENDGAEEEVVELGLGCDDGGEGRVDAGDEGLDGLGDVDGLVECQVGRLLRDGDEVVRVRQERARVDHDRQRAQQVAAPGSHGVVQLRVCGRHGAEGVLDGGVVGEDRRGEEACPGEDLFAQHFLSFLLLLGW